MTSTLALAARLGTLDDDALYEVVVARDVARPRVHDLFDLAEALLDPLSIQAVLTTFDRPTLATLAAASARQGPMTVADVASTLGDWGAIVERHDSQGPEAIAERLHTLDVACLLETQNGEYLVYDDVREHILRWPTDGLPSGPELAAAPPPAALAPVPDADPRFTDRLAAEQAFATVGAVTGLVIELEREPAHELQKGGLALPDTRRLSAALSIPVDQVGAVLWAGERAGLVTREGSSWFSTDSDWSALSTRQRWARLADSWLERLSPQLRFLLASRAHSAWGEGLREFVHWRYPAAGSELDSRLDGYARIAELLGVVARSAPSGPGALLLAVGPEEAADAMSSLFPHEVDKVYLQHDLSIVSPGPLEPAIDERLRGLAESEGRALASSYRVSASSLTRAIASGETEESLREFLTSISLTGIPQPLDYLLSEAASRYGRVRVSPAGEEGRSVVTSADEPLLGTIVVDHALTPLGLIRTGPAQLSSRFDPEVVFWALADARYPVAAEDAGGRIVTLKRHRPVPVQVAVRDHARELVERVKEAGTADSAETAEAWLVRQLESAIRARSMLIVAVSMPDGREVEYLLEPSGLGGGRLRGRDRAADIERTLPISSVLSVRTP